MARQHRGFTLVELPAVSRRKCAAFTLVELPAVSGRKRAAFTLVELLVVVAILAIILSMLLPALRAAREAGWSAACKSNQHQIGLAIAVYRQEYRGLYPPYVENQSNPASSTGVSRIHQLWGILNYLETIEDINWDGDPETDLRVPDVRLGFLSPHIQQSKKVLSCPAYRDLLWPDWPGWESNALNSYALNLWMSGADDVFGNSAGLRNESHLERATKIIDYADGTGHRLYMWWPTAYAFLGYPGSGNYLEDDHIAMRAAPWNRHIGMANFLMSDGHVVAKDAADFWYDEFWLNN